MVEGPVWFQARKTRVISFNWMGGRIRHYGTTRRGVVVQAYVGDGMLNVGIDICRTNPTHSDACSLVCALGEGAAMAHLQSSACCLHADNAVILGDVF